MTRYRHILPCVRGEAMPRSVVAVACETTDREEDGNPCRLRRVLRSWHAVACLMDAGRPGAIREVCGTDEDGWWSSLEWLLRRGGVTWIISCPAGQAFALLGVWRRIEDGSLTVSGTDSRNDACRHGAVQEMRTRIRPAGQDRQQGHEADVSVVRQDAIRRRRSVGAVRRGSGQGATGGYLVLQDPPTVLHARVAGTTGSIHWVDARNYGVNIADHDESARERVQRLHGFSLGMIGTLKSHGLGSLRDTAGSQAMHSFRKKHLRSVMLCHTVRQALDLEGASYYGGRCEAYRIGRIEGPVYHYDVRSLYPSVCSSHLLPVRLRGVCLDVPDVLAGQRSDLAYWIADVTIQTDEPAYPVRDGTLMVFPLGRFRTVLAGPELVDACERNRVVAWHAAASYDCEPALKSYADEMDQIRRDAEESGNVPLKQWSKAMSVCLPGKLGQKDRRWVTVGSWAGFGYYAEWHQKDKSGKWVRWRTVAGITQYEHVGDWHHDSVPAVASYITSAGRISLLSLLRACGWDNCYYCDTDSLFCSPLGSGRLVAAGLVRTGEMGYLRQEGVYHEMEIRGLKDYTVDGRRVLAGLPKGTQDNAGDTDAYWWQPWIGLATQRRQRPTADVVLKRYNRVQPYRHGTILAGGKVVPLQRWE